MVQALILAGGRGMRLSPLTNDGPTALLYLPGGTILDYLLYHLSLLPLSEQLVMLQYRGDQIARHLSQQARGVRPLRPLPQYAPFTLLSALASAAPWVEGPTLVLHGNFFFSHSLRHFIEQARPEQPTFLLPDSQKESGALSNVGAYLLPREAFYLAAQHSTVDSLASFYQILEEAGLRPTFLPYQGWSHCIRTPGDLLAVNRHLLTHWHELLHPPEAGIGYDAIHFSWVAPDADVDESVQGLFVTIGPRATVRDSRLYNMLLLPDVQLEASQEKNAVLARSDNNLLRLYAPHTRPALA